jgi:hypothetical protein
MLAERSAGKGVQEKAQDLVRGAAENDSTAHDRLEGFCSDIQRLVVFELPQLVDTIGAFFSYKCPSGDHSVFVVTAEKLQKAAKVLS